MDKTSSKTRWSECYAQLRSAIERGEFAQGSRLVERDICEQFGVSRATLRTVIHRLASQGIVQLEPRRGAQVMKLGVQDVADVLEVREVLEGLAASKAASQATQEDIAELRRLIGLMEKAVKNADYYEYNSFNRCFHEAIITASRNAKVIDALATIRAQLVQVHVRGLLMPGRAQHSLEEHQRLLAAIQKHDPAAAEAAARAHVQNHMQATLSALQRGVAI